MKLTPKPGLNRSIGMVLLVAMVPASLGYMYHEGSSPAVTVLRIDGAPEGIIFIADPHLRGENIDFIEGTVSRINALHPSVVLMGGDFMYRGGEDLPLNHVWSRIDAPVYAVLGNHDYLAGMGRESVYSKVVLIKTEADLHPESYDVGCMENEPINTGFAAEVVRELEKEGIRVLRNELVSLDIGGKGLVIVGLDDCWAGRTRPPEVPPTDAFTIYLIHEPECRVAWDADLILAGHTHGGQFMVGIPQVLDAAGVLELSGLKMKYGIPTYITRGIGTSNFNPQLRFLASPEIVVINPAAGS